MTIRARMTLWYAGVLLCSVSLITILSISEVRERHRPARISRGMMEIVKIVVGIGIPAVVLSVGGGWWLMRKALSPVGTLVQAAEKINERNLGEQLPRTGNGDELVRLTEVLNRMTARLDNSFSRIREFTLHASHELKTPLTVLCGEMETALRDESLSHADRERCASQLDELRRLSRIVDSLTLLTRADAGDVPLSMESVRLDELVRDHFDDTQILAEPHGIRVELAPCESVNVRGDRHRLRQLLLNLGDNAVKYNHPHGLVSIGLRRAGPNAELTITNTGPGIAPEILPRVFDRFFRGDPAHNNAVEGCGLGLSIAQWIAQAHHGVIEIVSEPAKNTTVTVRLPVEEVPPS